MHIFYSNCYPEEDCEGGSGLIYCGYARGVSNFLYLFVESVLPDTRSKEYFIIGFITFKIIIRMPFIWYIQYLHTILSTQLSIIVWCVLLEMVVITLQKYTMSSPLYSKCQSCMYCKAQSCFDWRGSARSMPIKFN